VTLAAEVVTDAAALDEATLGAWRDLAAEAGLPYATPEWMLGFWHGLHAPGGRLRVVVVRDGAAVVGIGPFYGAVAAGRAGLRELRLLGAGIGQRTGPLAVGGAEPEVAAAMLAALAGERTTRITLDAVDAAGRWPELLAVGGALRRRERVEPAPAVTLAESHDAWLAGRSRNFRGQLRRSVREIEARGAVVRRSAPEQLDADLAALFALHARRFASQGRATGMAMYVPAVALAVRALAEHDRARLWVIDRDGVLAGAQLHVHAGERVCFWNGGFDPEWEPARPGTVLLAAAIRDAHELGARVHDLGAGATPYKLRFADAEAPLAWEAVLPAGPRRPLERAWLAARGAALGARRAAKRVLRRG
jgi:CelD/BcsL family acetyltransferase involved in cellulose biosynthesis